MTTHDSSEVRTSFFSPAPQAVLTLFLTVLLTYGYFYQAGGHNANVRFDQIRAIAEQQTFEISGYAYNTADVIVHNEGLYPNKAPGLSLLAAPAWRFYYSLLSFAGVSSPALEEITCHLVSLSTIGLASALLAVCLYLVLLQCLGNSRWSMLLALAYSLATIAFPFSTLFFSHQLAAALLFISFSLLFFKRQEKLNSSTAVFLSGLLLGYSGTTEYPAVLAAIPIGIYAVFTLRFRKELWWFIGGGICGLGVLVIYNFLAFWDPFFIPYSAYGDQPEHMFSVHRRGYMGVGFPDLKILLEITLLPARGLFFFNPWLALLIPAMLTAAGKHKYRSERILCFVIVSAFFCFNAGFGDGIVFWGGGASVGPRHIVPMLPFSVLLIAFLFHKKLFRYIFYPFALFSFAVMLWGTSVEPQVPYDYRNPLVDLFWDGYLRSHLALQHHGVFDFAPIQKSFAAFNLGKLVGLPPPVQLLPLLLLLYFALFRTLRLTASATTEETTSQRINTKLLTVVFIAIAALPPAYAFSIGLRGAHSRGLVGSYYEGLLWPEPAAQLQEVPLPLEQLRSTRVDTQIIIPFGGRHNRNLGSVSVEWRGYLNVLQEGSYVIATESDDGSAVYINSRLIVNNWGLHDHRRVETRLHLERGMHPITVRYFNRDFGGSMILLWAPPEQHMQPIPAEHLLVSGPLVQGQATAGTAIE